MKQTSRLIVLHCSKTGDKSLVLQCYTKEWGRKSFIVSASSKGGMALYAPLNILEAEIVPNPKSALWRAHAFSFASPLNSIRLDVRKNTVALFLSEVLYKTLVEDQPDTELFEYLEKSILLFDSLQGDWGNFHLRFLLDYCGKLGFAPSPEDIVPFAGEYLGKLCLLLDGDAASSLLVPLKGEDRSGIAETILHYLSCHLEKPLDVRSLKILSEILHTRE